MEPVLVEKAPVTTYVQKQVQIGPGVVEKVIAPPHPAPEPIVTPVTYQVQKTYVRRPHHHRKHAYFNAGLSAG